MATRQEMLDELEVLLGAAHDLPEDSHHYLAEAFVARLEQRSRWVRVGTPFHRLRRRIVVALLALGVFVGGSLAYRDYSASAATNCYPTVVKTYPSWAAASTDAAKMRAHGFFVRSGEGGKGKVMQSYTLKGACK